MMRPLSVLWSCSVLFAAVGCALPTSSLRKEAQEATARGDHRKALELYEQELLRYDAEVWSEKGARTRRRDEAATKWLLEELQRRTAELQSSDPRANFALIQVFSDYAKSRGLETFHSEKLSPMIEKAGLARWPEVDAFEAKGQDARAMALAEELAKTAPQGGELSKRMVALGERAAGRERQKMERVRDQPGAAWLHLQLIRRYLRPQQLRHDRAEAEAKAKRQEDDDYSTDAAPFSHPLLNGAKAVEEAFHAKARFDWNVAQQGDCPALADPFPIVGVGVKATMSIRVSGCAVQKRQYTESAQRKWTEVRIERKEVPETVCKVVYGPVQTVCMGGGSSRTCSSHRPESQSCSEKLVWKDVEEKIEHDEYVPVEFTEYKMEGSGEIVVSVDGQSASSPVSIAVTGLSETFIGSGKPHTKSLTDVSLQDQFAEKLKANAAFAAGVAGRAVSKRHLAAAAASRGNAAADETDSHYVIAAVLRGDVPEEAAQWLGERTAMTAEELGALLLSPLKEKEPETPAPPPEVKPSLALNFPVPSKEMPSDVVRVDALEQSRDRAGENGLELFFSPALHQPTEGPGRFSNSGALVGARLTAGTSDASEALLFQLEGEAQLGFDLQASLQGNLAAGTYLGFRPGALSLSGYFGVGIGGAGSSETTPGAYIVPLALYLEYGGRLAWRFPGPVDVQVHLRQGHRTSRVEAALMQSLELRTVLHVLEARELISVGLRHTDYSDGSRPSGFTQLIVGYGAQ